MDSSLAAPRYDRLVILTTIFALVLRFWGLGERSFWVDEIFTLDVIAPSWGGLMQRAAALNDAPLFYLLVRPFHLLFGGEFGLRIFSVLCGTATIPLVYQLGKIIFSSKVGRLAALFLAISPFHLWFSQEARLYSLLILLWTGSTLVFLQLKENENPGRWIIYTVLLTLCLYTKVLSVFLFATHFLIWISFRRQTNWAPWKPFAAWFVALLLFAPIVPMLTQGLAEGGGSPRGPSLLELPYTLYSLVAGLTFPPKSGHMR
ncbi:MAG: glycosyltransferase family 39 protein [Planctomycetota bacterium]